MSSELERLQEKNHHLELINRFAVELLALKTEREVLWHVAREVVARLGFVDVIIYLLDETRGLLTQQAAFGDKNPRDYEILDPLRIELGSGVVGRVAATGAAMLIGDTRQFPDYIEDDAVRLSELAVPIRDGERILGVIDSEHPEPDFYTADHLATLSTVASITATKLRQLRTVAELEHTVEQLEHGKRLQGTLFQIVELSMTSESLDDFFIELHGLIGGLMYARNFLVALETEDAHGIRYHYASDEIDVIDTTKVYPARTDRPTLASYILSSQKPLLLNAASVEKLDQEAAITFQGTLPASLIGVRFGAERGNRGVVVLKSYDQNILYHEQDRDLIQFVSKHIHSAIERTRARHNLAYLALHDSLTGLPNRSLFMDRLQHALQLRTRTRNGLLGVLFLDLDRFKAVNDHYGHQVGDKYLVSIADRITSCLRSSDTLCRLGGDEFAILIESSASRDQILAVAQRVLDSVADPIWIGGIRIATTTSIGITCDDGGGSSAEALLREAAEAMYQAKARGRNGIRFYEPTKEASSSSNYRLEEDLAAAISGNQLFLDYQPIIKLEDRRIVGAESLVRWLHPAHGLIGPNQFIPDAEHTGLVQDIDIVVVHLALRWLHDNGAALPEGFRLSLNLSGQSLISNGVMATIRAMVTEAPEVAPRLCFEVTERAIVENLKDARRAIELLRELGIKVALDDFGTGYSSLSYLNKLPLDELKIDQSFIGSLESADSSRTIVETIVVMADALNMATVAEGIETRRQVDALIRIGCDMGQGFYLMEPGSGEALGAMLDRGPDQPTELPAAV